MGELLVAEQGPPSDPAAGWGVVWPDSVLSRPVYKDDAARTYTMRGGLYNHSVASQAGFAADTYVTGSGLILSPLTLKVGTKFQWVFDVTKTAAGTAAPTVNIRIGTLGTTGDASRVLFTLPAQTAAADAGLFQIYATMRAVGASGVIVGVLRMTHNVPAGITGLSTSISPNIVTVSSAFDTTPTNLIVGLSINGGASAAWTIQAVQAHCFDI